MSRTPRHPSPPLANDRVNSTMSPAENVRLESQLTGPLPSASFQTSVTSWNPVLHPGQLSATTICHQSPELLSPFSSYPVE